MTPIITKDFESLCDKEFQLAHRQAFEGLDREIADIREKFARTGNLKSSPMAQAVVDAVLARFDKVLVAFDDAYLAKWRNPPRNISDAEHEWLKAKAESVLESEVTQVSKKCNSELGDNSLVFQRFWEQAQIEARRKKVESFDKIEILRLRGNQDENPVGRAGPIRQLLQVTSWELLHPAVVKIAKSRFESGHFADAVEAALKDLNDAVKKIVLDQTGREYDGADLMNRAFSVNNPVIRLDDLTTQTGRDIQVGYMQIFAGVMTGIRNPKAHSNIHIDEKRAAHFLFLASLLFCKLDEAIVVKPT